MTTTDTYFAEIPVDAINVQENFNPRQRIDIDPGLVTSIQVSGVTVPIEVRVNGAPNRFDLISGHRRFVHAKEAGLKTIPAVVKPIEAGGEDELVHALIENMHRQDLTPYEEAKGLERLQGLGLTSRKALCAKTGLSDAVVKARLQLLDLPEGVAIMIGEGDIPFAAVERLLPWAKQAPAVCMQIADTIKSEDATAPMVERFFYRYVDAAVTDIDSTTGDPGVFQWQPHNTWELAEFDLGEKHNQTVEAVNERLTPRTLALKISTETLDQGRAAGCVIDVEAAHSFDEQTWITSQEWMAGAFAAALERKEIADEIKSILATDPEKPIEAPAAIETKDTRSYEDQEAELSEEKKAERKSEREQAKVDQERANAHNAELSKQLFERVKVDSPDPKIIDALIVCAIADHGVDWAMQGLRYLHPGWTYTDKTEAGNERTRLLGTSGDEAMIRLTAFLEAPTIEGKLTKFLQLVTAAYVADEMAVARTNRHGFIPSARKVPNGPTKLGALYKLGLSKLTPAMKRGATRVFEEKRSRTVNGPFDEAEFRTAGQDLGVSETDDE